MRIIEDQRVKDITFSDLEWMLTACALIEYRSNLITRRNQELKDNEDPITINKHINVLEKLMDRMGTGLKWD